MTSQDGSLDDGLHGAAPMHGGVPVTWPRGRGERDVEPLHRALGLTDDEFDDVARVLGREPNRLELALYAVMWSEHCSYKSSRVHLRRLPTEGPGVLVGPGENAGVIDAGDGIAVAIRIESHNHPSAIEPHQGAATGVGGILRDIFTMGARPLALMDPLFFGPLDDARQRWLFEGVVGGHLRLRQRGRRAHRRRRADLRRRATRRTRWSTCSAWARCRSSGWSSGAAIGPGNLAVLLGSATGRDGIGGVSVLASAGLRRLGRPGRPTSQAAQRPGGRPLRGEAADRGLPRAARRRPGRGHPGPRRRRAGLRDQRDGGPGRVGMDVDVSAVARREPGMEPWEVMTSESQERMLAIVTPERLAGGGARSAGAGRSGPR